MIVPAFAQADCSSGSTTTCYDSCTGGYIPVIGDSCETYYDTSRGCYASRGTCGGNDSSRNSCAGDSTSCYDSCTGSYVRYSDANSCTTAYNSGKGCYETLGYCNK